MRRLILIFAMLLTPLSIVSSASAQVNPFEPICDTNTDDASVCQTTGEDPISGENGVIIRVVGLLGWVVGFVSVLMMIIAALKYITANGDAAAVKSARDTIIYALIGVAVFAMSQIIVRFIISSL